LKQQRKKFERLKNSLQRKSEILKSHDQMEEKVLDMTVEAVSIVGPQDVGVAVRLHELIDRAVSVGYTLGKLEKVEPE
jgi:hypothetical protein